MDDLVKDMQKQIRSIRLEASIDRQQGKCYRADILDDAAAAFERVLLKYTQPAPYVPGYPQAGGWRISGYSLFPISHKS
jgi:hypothetical protein